jgi:hypothetical protein
MCRLDLLIIKVNISGPDLPIAITGHSMVTLGLGQAIIGGEDSYYVQQSKIYHMRCSHYICEVLILDKELSVPRGFFVAMPIPDHMSGCISESKFRCFCYKFLLG